MRDRTREREKSLPPRRYETRLLIRHLVKDAIARQQQILADIGSQPRHVRQHAHALIAGRLGFILKNK
jgi:hypothetical protein